LTGIFFLGFLNFGLFFSSFLAPSSSSSSSSSSTLGSSGSASTGGSGDGVGLKSSGGLTQIDGFGTGLTATGAGS
jgi:hypothetical protein